MKTGIIILIGLLILLVGEASGQNWRRISKGIKKEQLLVAPKSSGSINRYYDLRKKSNVLNKMKLIHVTDTILILQIYNAFSPCDLCSMIWNKIDTLSIVSEDCGKTSEIENQRIFTKYMMKLVSEWNLDEIRKEELMVI